MRNYSTVYVLIEVQCASARAWVCVYLFQQYKACRPVPTIRIYTVNRHGLDLCLQRSGDFAHVRQTNKPEYRSNCSVFGQSFDVLSGIWCEFDVMCSFAAGACAFIRACARIRTYSVCGHVLTLVCITRNINDVKTQPS